MESNRSKAASFLMLSFSFPPEYFHYDLPISNSHFSPCFGLSLRTGLTFSGRCNLWWVFQQPVMFGTCIKLLEYRAHDACISLWFCSIPTLKQKLFYKLWLLLQSPACQRLNTCHYPTTSGFFGWR